MMKWLQGWHNDKAAPHSFEGDRIYVRPPRKEDWEIWYYVRQRSRNHLEPWEATWLDSHMTEEYFHKWIRQQKKKRSHDQSYFHFIFLKETNELMGAINIIHVLRGIAQTASLGYWIGKEFSGNGFMSEAMSLILPYGYDTLRLHRYQAAVLKQNHASIALLKKYGFRQEGVAEKFLHVNGKWRDHLIFALTKEEWEKGSGRTKSTGQFLRINA